MNQPVYMADIQNKIYEAGLIRQEERIVLTAENCVLLEYYTGKTYSYRMVELTTLKAKRLFSKAAPLNESGYQKAMEKCFHRQDRNRKIPFPSSLLREQKIF